MTRSPRRSTALGLAAASVLTVAALAVVPGPAGAVGPAIEAPPAADCTPAYTGAYTSGQTVHGLTVVSGTDPVTFTGTVLGVLDQGIDSATPLIMMKLGTGSQLGDLAIQEAGGVWEGMSGSPVYDDATGDLIGAVSRGLAYGSSQIIGITPFTAMEGYLGGASPVAASGLNRRIPITDAKIAARVAKAAGITTAQAALGTVPLRQPIQAKGLSAAEIKRLTSKQSGLHHVSASPMGATPAATVPASTLVAGGNLGAMLVWGDYVEGGIGTVTSVCDGRLVGFGHELLGTGPDEGVAMTTASAVAIQNDPLNVPFKIANVGDAVGTIDQDNFMAIAGTFDGAPQAATFTNVASYNGGTPRTSVDHALDHDFYIDAAYYGGVYNDITVMRTTKKGGAGVTFTISGTDPAGHPFTLHHVDKQVSPYDIAGDSLIDFGNLVYALQAIPGVTLTSVSTNSTINDDPSVLRITGVQQKVGAGWVKVSQKRPIHVRAGQRASLRLVVSGANGSTSYIATNVGAKASQKGGRGSFTAQGGYDYMGDPSGVTSVAAAQKYVAGMLRHDTVAIGSHLAKGKVRTSSRVVSAPQAHVIGGMVAIPVVVD